jgi:hypothetical protein
MLSFFNREKTPTVTCINPGYLLVPKQPTLIFKYASKREVDEYIGQLSIRYVESVILVKHVISKLDFLIDRKEITLDHNIAIGYYKSMKLTGNRRKSLENACQDLLFLFERSSKR